MKHVFLFFIVFFSTYIHSQYVVDSVGIEQFSYDSTITDNQIWQIGETDKVFFDNEWVLVTDTTNMYNASIDASINMVLTRNSEWAGYVIDFDHKVDSDTNSAGGYFEINLDNDTMYYDYEGSTYATWWLRFKNDSGNNENWNSGVFELLTDSGHTVALNDLTLGSVSYSESIISAEGYHDTLSNGIVGFTGEYEEWKDVHIELFYLIGLKTQDIQDTLNFRFHFMSNPSSSGKNGWAIKNIHTGWVYYGGLDANKMNTRQIMVYPNPASNVVIASIDNPKNKLVKIEVYTVDGRVIDIFTEYGSELILDLSTYDSGTYVFNYIIGSEIIGYSKIIKE